MGGRCSSLLGAVMLCLTVTFTAAAPAAAETPPAGQVRIGDPLGRHLRNWVSGRVQCSAQGERVDSNGNGLDDRLRGRSACNERTGGITRAVIYWSVLQVQINDTWVDQVREDTDRYSVGDPFTMVDYTPAVPYCPGVETLLTYRLVHRDGFRGSSGTLYLRTTTSFRFQARMLVAHPDC
jgi:hypothetical protein